MKKDGWGGGGHRIVNYNIDDIIKEVTIIKPKLTGKICEVRVGRGLPNDTSMLLKYIYSKWTKIRTVLKFEHFLKIFLKIFQ